MIFLKEVIKIKFNIALGIIFVVFIAFVAFMAMNAHASEDKGLNAECQINQSGKDCDEGLVCVPFNERSGNGKCEYLQVSPVPTDTPTPTPEPTATPDPTPTPCDTDWEEIGYWREVNPCPTQTPEPTATPSDASPSATPSMGNDNPLVNNTTGAPSGPQCSGIMLTPIFKTIYRKDPFTVHAEWTSVDSFVSHYKVEYGLGPMTMWNTIVEGNSVDLGFLPQGLPIWVRVAGYESGCTGNFNQFLDPK